MTFGRAFELTLPGRRRLVVGERQRRRSRRPDPTTANAYEPRGFRLLTSRPSRRVRLWPPVVVWGRSLSVRRLPRPVPGLVLPCQFCGTPVWPGREDFHGCVGLEAALEERFEELDTDPERWG